MTAPTLPAPLSIGLVVVGIVALPVLTTTYMRRYGVSASRWGLLPAGIVFLATIVLGRRYDAALRLELAGGDAAT